MMLRNDTASKWPKWRQNDVETTSKWAPKWPIRNPALKVQESEEGIVTIELPRRRDWLGSLLAFLFSVPASRPVELDEVGSLVWRLCDGEHTVDDIATTKWRLKRRNTMAKVSKRRRSVEVTKT